MKLVQYNENLVSTVDTDDFSNMASVAAMLNIEIWSQN